MTYKKKGNNKYKDRGSRGTIKGEIKWLSSQYSCTEQDLENGMAA